MVIVWWLIFIQNQGEQEGGSETESPNWNRFALWLEESAHTIYHYHLMMALIFNWTQFPQMGERSCFFPFLFLVVWWRYFPRIINSFQRDCHATEDRLVHKSLPVQSKHMYFHVFYMVHFNEFKNKSQGPKRMRVMAQYDRHSLAPIHSFTVIEWSFFSFFSFSSFHVD